MAKTDSTASTVQSSADKKYIPKKEFWMFSVAAMGQGMIYATMSSYISDYYANVLQVPLLFILLLMLFARVWDAVNDPMMGVIVDKYTTRWGKMKPYVLFTAIPIAVLTFLMFFNPGFGSTGTMVYAAIVYILWGMIYTVSDVPYWSLPNVMTPNPQERADTISFGRTLNGVGSAIPMGLFLVLGWVISDMQMQYTIISTVSAVIGIGLFILSYFSVKERVVIPPKPKRDKNQPSMLKRIFTCKPLMLIVIMGILSSGRYMMQAAAVHVARYAFYIGKPLEGLSPEAAAQAISGSVGTVTTLFTVCSAVGMFGAMLFMPLLFRKFNYKRIVIVSSLGGFVASCVTTVLGALSIFTTSNYLVYVCIPFIIIQCIPLGALNITSYAMIGDSLDYLEWKTGVRDNALGSACQSFVNKLGNALATVMVIAMYLIVNIDPAAMYAENAVVAATDLSTVQRFAMFSLVSIVPGVSLLLCTIPIFFYDLVGAKKTQITEELAAMRSEEGITIG